MVRVLRLILLAAVLLTGCGENGPARLADLPLPNGLQIVEELSTCDDADAFCEAKALVANPAADDWRELLDIVRRDLTRRGWSIYADDEEVVRASADDFSVSAARWYGPTTEHDADSVLLMTIAPILDD